MDIEVSYVGLLLASIASLVLGFLWYSPMLFGATWQKLRGYTSESMKTAQKEMGKLYGLSYVVSLVTAYMLAHVMGLSANFYHYSPTMTALSTAFSMWLGFVMPVQVTATIFGDKKWGLFAIDSGYQLASLVVMSLVLALF